MSADGAIEQRQAALRQRLAQWRLELARLDEDLPTPCLLADMVAVRANLRAGEAAAARLGADLRPHAKAHKCSSLLRLQLAPRRAVGVTCATADEAHALAQLGFSDVMLANEVASRHGWQQVGQAALGLERLIVAADSAALVEAAARTARSVGRTIGVVVDVDVGSGRCGIPVDDAAVVACALAVARERALRFDGLMAYASHANYEPDEQARRAVASSVREALERARARLEAAGLEVGVISGGSTGTCDLDQGLTELQLGSYPLMEGRYAWTSAPPFTPALVCASTVVSRPTPERAVLDAGWKALSAEFGLPLAPPPLVPLRMADEHLVCAVSGPDAPAVGDVVALLPAHLDPTVNLHRRILLVEDGRLDGEWAVDVRTA